MKILLKNATILNPQSPFHSSQQDILIESGVITQVSDEIKADNQNEKNTFYNLLRVQTDSLSLVSKSNIIFVRV